MERSRPVTKAVGSTPSAEAGRPRVVVVGLGPAGGELVPEGSRRMLAGASRCFVRTTRHPAVEAVGAETAGGLESFDRLYESARTIDEVYGAIVEELVAAAEDLGPERYVAYAVPGSPFVAERTVVMLRDDGRVAVEVVPAPSFLDLAWDRLGIDPVAMGVRLVDGARFAVEAAGERGPLLIAQCHSRQVLSDIKLAGDDAAGDDAAGDEAGGDDAGGDEAGGDEAGEGAGRTAVLLHHLGLEDEVVVEVAWSELDRSLEPDHLTAVWVARMGAPVAVELARLDELVHTLRERCPWDRKQTHGSLAGHLLEETYETLDAIEAVARSEPDVAPGDVEHLAEELGDLLFQVYFHAVLGGEEGWFTLADVARGVHDKLVARHPHVFGDVVAETAEEVAAGWEVRKLEEKGRSSVTEGIPGALPALALAAKLLKKAGSVGMELPDLAGRRAEVVEGLRRLEARGGEESGSDADEIEESAEVVGAVLWGLADVARRMGVDPETALRTRAGEFRRQIEAREIGAREAGTRGAGGREIDAG